MGGPVMLIRGLMAAVLVMALLVVGPGAEAVAQEAQEVPEAEEAAPRTPEVDAAGAVLYDPLDEQVLWGREETVARPMASTTKILTVLLALESASPDDTVTVSATAAGTGGATLDLVAGQEIPLRSLLAGLMLRSGNDAAVAVAEHVAGSEAAFTELMNDRARELGLEATTFVNASGLTTDPTHASSPLDLARLTLVAMADETFAELAGSGYLTVPGLAPLESRNELLTVRPYPGATGVKTGFTTLSGLTLVASATRGDRSLYAVVLNTEDSFGDAAALLDHGFDDYARPTVATPAEPVGVYRWAGDAVEVVPAMPLVATVPARGPTTWRVRWVPDAVRPLDEGAVLGVAELAVGGRGVATVDLVAAAALPEPAELRDGAAVGAAVADALRSMARTHLVDRPVPSG